MTISRHVSRVTVGDLAFEPTGVRLELHELRVPYARLTATAAADPEVVAALDPTAPDKRVSVTLRQDFGSGETLASVSADYAGLTLADMGGRPENLVTNGGFEVDTSGWAGPAVTMTRDTVVKRFGSGSLRFEPLVPSDSASEVYTANFPVSSGGFIVRASGRGSDVNVSNIALDFDWLDADGVPLGGSGQFLVVDPDPDVWYDMAPWHAVPASFPGTATGRLSVFVTFPSATDKRIWLDGVEVHEAYDTLAGISAAYGEPYNTTGTRPSTHVRCDLMLRAREVDHRAGTVTIEATSGEAALIDYGLVSRSAMVPGTATVRGCVNMVLAHVLQTAVSTVGTGSEPVESEATSWLPGESAWSYLASIVGSAGLRLWCDEVGLWHLADPELEQAAGNTVQSVDSLTELADSISRDETWADSAVVTYRWEDSSGVVHVVHDVSNTQGTKTISLEQNRPFPGYGLARAIVRKAKSRKRVLRIGSVSSYSVRPYQAAQVSVPGLAAQAGVVAGVTWLQPADEMTVETRDVISIGVNSWLYTPAGVSWDDVPAGTSWTEYEWMG